jgi:hypothetical protein
MTNQQIDNFRKVLCTQMGPLALIMPKEEVVKVRDKMQSWANNLDLELKAKRAHELVDLVEITTDEIEELHKIIEELYGRSKVLS